MSLVFFGYIISAFLAKPDWSEVAARICPAELSDSIRRYLFTVMALIGTTITPFMQVFVQSSVVEKGMDKEDYPLARADVIVGTMFACLIAAFIVISTAATLNKQRHHRDRFRRDRRRRRSRRSPANMRNIFSPSGFSARRCWRWAFCRWRRLIP